MTMIKELHSGSGVTQLYVLSKYDGRDLWNVETA